jgi:mycothiol system anti-sigma-R factor
MSCGNPHETDCSEVLERLYEYLDGELDAHYLGKIEQHLHECGPCLTEHDVDLMLKALVRRSCGGDCAPDDLRARIMLQITQVRLQLG